MGVEGCGGAGAGGIALDPGPQDQERGGRGAAGGPPVYVRVEGPQYLSDEEMLLRAKARTDELEEVVRRWERIAEELERERVEDWAAASAREDAIRGDEGVVPEGVCGAREDGAMGRQAGSRRSRAGCAAGGQCPRGVEAGCVGGSNLLA